WQSLKQDMPAISVRDLQVKDDSTCLCSDLVAATHGRGFWILDDVTPLRQAASAQAAKQSATSAYLFKPAIAVRVRFATNDPTPWPPEVPAGENPPPGGIIDYYLTANTSGPVMLDILDSGGRVIRSYSSTDSIARPHPALDPVAYNRLCQRNPATPDCSLPLYWPAPPMVISTQSGMHRFSWDLHYDPIAGTGAAAAGGDDATGAVPHRTYPTVEAPWAPPGAYTVRLTVGGKSYTQPLMLRLDPRVTTPAAGLAQLASLSREMYDGAVASHAAYVEARALLTQLDSAHAGNLDALRSQLEELAPPAPIRAGRRGGGARGAAATAQTPTLLSVSNSMLAAAMAMQGADTSPTAAEVAASTRARDEYGAVLPRWKAVRATARAELKAKRPASHR
ncbi:MAG: hypothetical protein ACR2MQ_15480, partial [Gemmatimonadaceae bacterium]